MAVSAETDVVTASVYDVNQIMSLRVVWLGVGGGGGSPST